MTSYIEFIGGFSPLYRIYRKYRSTPSTYFLACQSPSYFIELQIIMLTGIYVIGQAWCTKTSNNRSYLTIARNLLGRIHSLAPGERWRLLASLQDQVDGGPTDHTCDAPENWRKYNIYWILKIVASYAVSPIQYLSVPNTLTPPPSV